MALTTYPECKGKVSDTAKTCPHCGFELMNEEEIDIYDKETTKKARKGYWECYIFSFIIPIFGIIIGTVLMSKPLPEERHAGETCLGLGVGAIIIAGIIVGVRFLLIWLR